MECNETWIKWSRALIRPVQARLLFDMGSNDTYIKESTAKKNGFTLSKFHKFPVTVFGDQTISMRLASTSFEVQVSSTEFVTIQANTAPTILQDIQNDYKEFTEALSWIRINNFYILYWKTNKMSSVHHKIDNKIGNFSLYLITLSKIHATWLT